MFRDLVYEYPTSDRIGLSAFYIAELYRDPYDDNIRALAWYERVRQWDPDIRKPVLYRTATLYDLRLCDYDNALKYYRLCIRRESQHRDNVKYAEKRIKVLSQ
jgi:hypothetical protein